MLELCHEIGISCGDLLDLPPKRQREKAAERLLLCHAFGHPVALSHTSQGAPFIDGVEVNISITHTMRLVALALNDTQIIGLDAEQVDRPQVLKVRNKFLNACEQQFIAPDDLAAHIIAWTAKEAIIKAERNSALDWTDGISLEPFNAGKEEITFDACCACRRDSLFVRRVDAHFLTLALPLLP